MKRWDVQSHPNIKKYLLMMPVILYPYMYIVFIVLYFTAYRINSEPNSQVVYFIALIVSTILYNLYSIIAVIVFTVKTARGKQPVAHVSLIILIMKIIHLPSYLFHIMMIFFSALLSVWGVGFMLFALIILLCTMFLSGLCSIGCSIRIFREKTLSLPLTILTALCLSVPILDVTTSLAYAIITDCIFSNKKSVNQQNSIMEKSLPR